jgi:hypothetical protein
MNRSFVTKDYNLAFMSALPCLQIPPRNLEWEANIRIIPNITPPRPTLKRYFRIIIIPCLVSTKVIRASFTFHLHSVLQCPINRWLECICDRFRQHCRLGTLRCEQHHCCQAEITQARPRHDDVVKSRQRRQRENS